jgi:hypothetical protein
MRKFSNTYLKESIDGGVVDIENIFMELEEIPGIVNYKLTIERSRVIIRFGVNEFEDTDGGSVISNLKDLEIHYNYVKLFSEITLKLKKYCSRLEYYGFKYEINCYENNHYVIDVFIDSNSDLNDCIEDSKIDQYLLKKVAFDKYNVTIDDIHINENRISMVVCGFSNFIIDKFIELFSDFINILKIIDFPTRK